MGQSASVYPQTASRRAFRVVVDGRDVHVQAGPQGPYLLLERRDGRCVTRRAAAQYPCVKPLPREFRRPDRRIATPVASAAAIRGGRLKILDSRRPQGVVVAGASSDQQLLRVLARVRNPEDLERRIRRKLNTETVPTPIPQAWAIARCDNPRSCLRRRISRIFLTSSLRAGIASPSFRKASVRRSGYRRAFTMSGFRVQLHRIRCSTSRISVYLQRTAQRGLGWPLPAELDDAALEARLFPRAAPVHDRIQPAAVDAAGPPRRREDVHRLLGEAAGAGRPAHRGIAARRAVRRRTRREQLHLRRGDRHPAVARLGRRPHPHGRGLRGTTALWVPDQLNSAIARPCRYEPGVNRTYEDLAAHYGVVEETKGQSRRGGRSTPGPAVDTRPAPRRDVLQPRRSEPGDPRFARRAQRPEPAGLWIAPAAWKTRTIRWRLIAPASRRVSHPALDGRERRPYAPQASSLYSSNTTSRNGSRTPLAKTDGRKPTEERRCAPTSVHVRRNPCSRSPDPAFNFTGIRTRVPGASLRSAPAFTGLRP